MKSPTPQAIKNRRLMAGLTQTEAGLLVDISIRQWIRYESGDQSMPGRNWKLFKQKLKR